MPENIRQCVPIAIEIINKRTQDRVIDIISLNKKRHYLLKTKKGLKYYMMFKREFFKSFGKIFNKFGSGESINREYIDAAMALEVDAFLLMYQKGEVYIVPPTEWLDYAQENNTIRSTHETNETTLSIPTALLRRWK